MILEFLQPISEEVLQCYDEALPGQIGNYILKHTSSEFPDLSQVKIALVGVVDEHAPYTLDVEEFRKQFYQLHTGQWNQSIADLGDLMVGASAEDTYFALKGLVKELHQYQVLPIIIGGTQDLTYGMYRAYENLDQMINLANVDGKFDIQAAEISIPKYSYVSRMILEAPIYLHNVSNLGYQTYLNSHESIELMDRLYFDMIKLGDLHANIHLAEPYLRDADIVSVDLTSVEASYIGFQGHNNPNGFNGKEICAMARYAGISDRVTTFGIFEGKGTPQESFLTAQMVWYFIEGFHFRAMEYPITNRNNFTKYIVPVDHQEMIFYKSNLTGKWWMEIELNLGKNNKNKNTTLLPCSHEDYLLACNQEIPDRWWRAYRKQL